MKICLNGLWDTGDNRIYQGQTLVPGLPRDPLVPQHGQLWYRRKVKLPMKDYRRVFLCLSGARFCPSAYVNGQFCSSAPGGMAPLQLELFHWQKGQEISLEICLQSLSDMDTADASRISEADFWRTNLSSCLWDDVYLLLMGEVAITEVIPSCEDHHIFCVLKAEMKLNGLEACRDWLKHRGLDACKLEADLKLESLNANGAWVRRYGLDGFKQKATLRLGADNSLAWMRPGKMPDQSRQMVSVACSEDRVSFGVDRIKTLDRWCMHHGALYRLTLRISVPVLCRPSSRPVASRKHRKPYSKALRNPLSCFRCLSHSSLSVQTGFRKLQVEFRSISLEGKKLHLRGTSVVWHRFCRDPEGRSLAFDREWFRRNVFDALEASGVNFIRFHLGLPPEWMLYEADRRGLCVQLEWHFFHGITASKESMQEQWHSFFVLAARHPCVFIAQLWNEAEASPEAIAALNALRLEMPLPLLDHIDVIPIHKYWWSLFENLNLSYRDANDLRFPAIADEFGGNYLDGECKPGSYPDVIPAFERFLGKNPSTADMIELQVLSHARVAEYWRQMDVVGFATFCLLGSPEDGSHLFLSPMKDGRCKPVWQACRAAWAGRSICLECWDRAFMQGASISVNLHFYSDDAHNDVLTGTFYADRVNGYVQVLDERGYCTFKANVLKNLRYYHDAQKSIILPLPAYGERCTLQAVCGDAVSSWPVRLSAQPSAPKLTGLRVGINQTGKEYELNQFLQAQGFVTVPRNQPCDLMIIRAENRPLPGTVLRQMKRGIPLLWLQCGPMPLGEAYLQDKRQVRVDGIAQIQTESNTLPLPCNLEIRFETLPEAESCCHPAEGGEALWKNLPRQALQLSNGYRGGLNVPAAKMTLCGTTKEDYRKQWMQRGADEKLFHQPEAVAYSLNGFYAFAAQPDDQVRKQLRMRVQKWMEDAPSLAANMSQQLVMEEERLGEKYAALPEEGAKITPLMLCGHGLNRCPTWEVRLPEGKGHMIISQLLTDGRLTDHDDYNIPYFYDWEPHSDPEIQQMVLNLMTRLMEG